MRFSRKIIWTFNLKTEGVKSVGGVYVAEDFGQNTFYMYISSRV